jgi:hypothetical protein
VRDRFGAAMQITGLILMPVALYQGMRDDGSLGTELLLGGLGFLLIFVGRGLRGGTPPK